MHRRARHITVFLLLLLGSFITYYYALADTPRRDQGTYIIERALSATDWDWFWHSVSYSRTRFLHPGDSYLFRPLHMAVVALKDIFFRSNLFALGAINIMTMAVAAFSLYFFSSKLLRPLAAILVALLFMVQYAGLEMVAWGHISPYLLALAFFGFALASLLEAGPDNKAALKKAGAFLLLGALVHEMVVVALVLAAPLLLLVWGRKGKDAAIGGIPLRSYILWVVAAPLLIYLGLDLIDYFYHGAPLLFSAAESSVSGEKYGPLNAIFAVAGASAVAVLAPFKVKLAMSNTGLLAWNFGDIRPYIIGAGIVLSSAMVLGVPFCIWFIRGSGDSRRAFVGLLSLLLFIGVIFGLGLGRIYLRGISYFYSTTYYYSITAYIYCIILAIGLHHLDMANGKKMPLFISRIVIGAIVFLIAINFMKTREALVREWPERREFASMHLELKDAVGEYSERYCLAGSAASVEISLALLRDLTCQKEDMRVPGYLVTTENRSIWLAELNTKPIGDFGKPYDVVLETNENPWLSPESYDRPDISLTVHNKAHVYIAFWYQSLQENLYIELYGPLLSGTIVTPQGDIPLIRYVGLPYVNSTQRLEFRHGTIANYVFVDGHLMAAIPQNNKVPGKIGVSIEGNGNVEQAISDFMVAPSAPYGAEPVGFMSVAKLLERP